MDISRAFISVVAVIAVIQGPLCAEPTILFADQMPPGQTFDGSLREGELNIYFWRNSETSPLGLIRCSRNEAADTQKALVSKVLKKALFFESKSAVLIFERSILKDKEDDPDDSNSGTIIAVKSGDQVFLLNDTGNGEGKMLLRIENAKVEAHQAGFLMALNRALSRNE